MVRKGYLVNKKSEPQFSHLYLWDRSVSGFTQLIVGASLSQWDLLHVALNNSK